MISMKKTISAFALAGLMISCTPSQAISLRVPSLAETKSFGKSAAWKATLVAMILISMRFFTKKGTNASTCEINELINGVNVGENIVAGIDDAIGQPKKDSVLKVDKDSGVITFSKEQEWRGIGGFIQNYFKPVCYGLGAYVGMRILVDVLTDEKTTLENFVPQFLAKALEFGGDKTMGINEGGQSLVKYMGLGKADKPAVTHVTNNYYNTPAPVADLSC